MHRVRFEPIDTDDQDDFILLYNKIRDIINSVYADEYDEVIPSIIKVYPVDDLGFPLGKDGKPIP